MVILHEIAHALQYYSYKLNNFRCKPHGPTWRNFYRRLRNVFLNPYLEPQHDAKVEYQGMIDEVEGVKPNSLSRRAASR
jgi:predicted SprT family Zn-dependent metalloprotease